MELFRQASFGRLAELVEDRPLVLGTPMDRIGQSDVKVFSGRLGPPLLLAQLLEDGREEHPGVGERLAMSVAFLVGQRRRAGGGAAVCGEESLDHPPEPRASAGRRSIPARENLRRQVAAWGLADRW